jgi:hypothetical protein
MTIDPRRQPALRASLLLAIFTMAGPEIFVALEMATLLELLGAFLFLTAFWTALKMTAIDSIRWIGGVLAPPPLLAICRHGRWPLEKAGAALLVLGRAGCVLLAIMVGHFYVQFLAG